MWTVFDRELLAGFVNHAHLGLQLQFNGFDHAGLSKERGGA